jgi:hypothetical protein
MNGFSATASMASATDYSSFVPSRRVEKIDLFTDIYEGSAAVAPTAISIQNLQSLICCAPHKS